MKAMTAPLSDVQDGLAIRPPQQRRSREGWARILDAGVALLEEGGLEAFTIAAVCDRAQVPPRAIYARTSSKDALFLAVYEHGMARVRADQDVLVDSGRWSHLDERSRVRWAVSAVADVFAAHAPFLRAVVLSSGMHPEVARRGRAYAEELTEAFAGVVLSAGPALRPPDPAAAVRTAFSTVFASLVMHTAYGPTFAWAGLDERSFRGHLAEMVADHLLGWPPAR
jgi:AcrR family transcriptional regulator